MDEQLDAAHAAKTITALLVGAIGRESTLETREAAREIVNAGLRGWEEISNESLRKQQAEGVR